jgi:hypothetical protein
MMTQENSSAGGRVAILVSVHRTAGHGLTQEVEGLFRYNPRKWLALSDVMDCVRRSASRPEVNSILHKMSNGKGLLDVERRLVPSRSGATRWISFYRWRI